jgi:hypothetical protein
MTKPAKKTVLVSAIHPLCSTSEPKPQPVTLPAAPWDSEAK